MSIAAPPPRLTDRVTTLSDAGGHVLHAAFLGDRLAVVRADGRAALHGEGRPTVVDVDAEGLLVAASDSEHLVMGGVDGQVRRLTAAGALENVGDGKGWIDALAIGPDGAVAWSVGKRISARDRKGRIATLDLPSTARGLAFLPKGYRLAAAHYGGVALWFPGTEMAPETLAWKGSHIDVTVSADGRYVVTSMQENALHGWRVVDRAHMRMTGYPGKTRGMSWSHDGNWLATSGAEAAIVWPFSGKDGPMGKAPREAGVRPARVSAVAFHPGALVLAVGYVDGWVLLIRLTDASELLVRAPEGAGGGAITALAWHSGGKRLAIGAADGFAGLLNLP
jgi:WD40 repeat protein